MYIPSGITPMTFYEQHKNEFTHARITFTNSNIVFEDDDFESEGIEIRQYMNSATDLTFGTASCVEVEIHMFRSSVTDTLKWSEEFLLEFGFDVTNGTIWLPIGYFTGSKPTRTQVDVIQFIAYDRMTKFDILADDFIDSIDFTSSKTLTQIYSALCTYVGVTSESGNEIAANMAHSYSKFPVGKGCSCRDILAKIAEAAGCYAIITREGKVKMVWYTDHTEDFVLKRDDIYAVDVAEIDWLYNASLRKKWIDLETERWKDLESLTWKELEGYYSPTKVNAVKFVYSDEDVGITVPNDLATTNIYTIVNNPFLYGSTTQETTGYLTNLYNRLQAFGIYVPVSVECIGNMFVEPGDIIKLEFEDNSVGRYPVFNRTIHYNGALTCVYETTGNLDREPVSEANKQKMEAGGKIHILRNTVDELYSEINDPETGLRTLFNQQEGQIQILAEHKATLYYSATAPTGTEEVPLEEGDLWIDTANNNQLKRYNGSVWGDASFDDPDKYTVRSGVDILPEGVEVTGGKYVKIESGGIFEVDSSNFKVKSDENLVQSGDWRMTDDGFAGVWKDKHNSDRCLSIRKEVNAATMPEDLDECTCGVFMYSINSTASGQTPLAENEQFWITLAYPNTTGLNPQIVRYRNGYFRFLIKKTPQFYWYEQDGTTFQYYLVTQVFHCGSIGYAATGFIIETGFFKNLYTDTIEPYTTDDISTNYQSTTTSRGHCGTSSHKWAYIYGYYIYYNTLTQLSSRDVKKNIQALPSVGEKIDKLQPVTFVYKDDEKEKQRTGLVYEDTIDVMPEICQEDEEQKSINYIELIPMLLKEIQDLRKRVADLESRL